MAELDGRQITVRLRRLDGTWETCGVDRLAGIYPEDVELTADRWGYKSAQFVLRRDPAAIWPDITAFTEVTIDVDGSRAWEGRVIDTPSRDTTDQVITVACEGWQAHLDDDLVDRVWVHDDLTAWKDYRSFPGAPLGSGTNQFPAGYQVNTGDGKISLSIPNGSPMVQNTGVAVILDLGPGRLAKRIVATWTSTWTAASMKLFARGVPDGLFHGASDYADAFVPTLTAGPTTSAGNLGDGYRYIVLNAFYTAASTTAGLDVTVTLSSVKVFGETAYESSNASVLKASTVISDAIRAGTLKLSADMTGIEEPSSVLPVYAPDGPRTPREHIDAVNAYHGWSTKIGRERRPIFRARSSAPKYEIGSWSGAEIQDASGGSGQDLFNRVIVTGTDPAGQPVRADVTAASVPGFGSEAAPGISWPNPSFDTNTTGWTGDMNAVLTRTTVAGEYDTGPGGGKFTSTALYSNIYTLSTGTAPVAGRLYELVVRLKASASTDVNILFGGAWPANQSVFLTVPASGWITQRVYARPRASDTQLSCVIWAMLNSKTLFVDSLQLNVVQRTLPDRAGFTRTKQLQVAAPLPTDGAAATAIGQTFLTDHAATPFRGSLTLTGRQAIRNRLSGQPVPLHQLLADTDELISLTDRVNPDDGTVGRAARISEVTYRPAEDVATVTLDNTRSDFDALLARLQVAGGQ